MPSTMTVPYKGKFVTFELFSHYNSFGGYEALYFCHAVSNPMSTTVKVYGDDKIDHSAVYDACYARVNN
jgi:hypothetical protein